MNDNNYVYEAKEGVFEDGIENYIEMVHNNSLLFGLWLFGDNFDNAFSRNAEYLNNLDLDYLYFRTTQEKTSAQNYQQMGNLLKENIYYSIAKYTDNSYSIDSAKDFASSWTTNDTLFDPPTDFDEIITRVNRNDRYYQLSSLGHYNDLGFLQTDSNILSITEIKTQFGLWAISKSPLIIQNSLENICSDVIKILQNEEIIAINQD